MSSSAPGWRSGSARAGCRPCGCRTSARPPRAPTQPERIAADPEYGRIVCFCERVTRGRDPRRRRQRHPAGRPRRAAPAHARPDGPLPGLLLRSPVAALLAEQTARTSPSSGRRRGEPRRDPARDRRRRRGRRRPGRAGRRDGAARAGSAGSWCSSARPSRGASRATRGIRASGCATCTAPCPGPATRRRIAERRARQRRRAAHRDAGHRLGGRRRARADRPAGPEHA